MDDSLHEFTLYELLSHSNVEHHANIRMLWADPKVQYLVLFADQYDGKAIITIGPDLDYRNLEEVTGLQLDAMIPVAFIKGRHFAKFDSPRKKILERLSNATRNSSHDPFRGPYGVAPAEPMPSAATPRATDAAEVRGRFASAAAEGPGLSGLTPGKGAGDAPAELSEAWKELKRREEGVENLRQEMLAREAFITESENRLLEISQQHHEQQEELNHRLESLRKWELQLNEREQRLKALEVSAS